MATLQSESAGDAETRQRAAASWVRKFIRDVYEDKTGLVHDYLQLEDGTVRLLARFSGETESRRVSLDRVTDGHYLSPDDPRARYRPLTADEQDQLNN